MKAPLRILHLEDDPKDAELIQATLETEGLVSEVTRVETQDDFLASLERDQFDLIFADYTLPSFDGLTALKIALEKCPDLPFIFISGTLGEEVAIEALKLGATDYVVKGRLSRIVPLVHRALREARERGDRKRAENALRRGEAYLSEAQRLSRTGSFGWDISSGEIYWSPETFRIFGYDQAIKPTLELVLQRTHPEDRALFQRVIDRASRQRKEFDFERRLLMPDGSIKYLQVVAHASAAKSGNVEFVGAVMDVTERKWAQEALEKAQAELAHVARVATLGEMMASIAHEINQPLGAIANNASACLRWLDAQKLDGSATVCGSSESGESSSQRNHRTNTPVDQKSAAAKGLARRKRDDP